jgi:recombination associated protein RdgC
MQLIEKAKDYEFLGREFLVWLWFRSETKGGVFSLGESESAELWFEGRIVLQPDEGDRDEKVICLGEISRSKEARLALAEFKTVTEAKVRLRIGENEWSFVLDSTWLNFKSFKTPKVVQDTEQDPDGLFYEKFYLIDQALSAMDAVFASFISLRLSTDWEENEFPALLEWINQGRQKAF